MENHPLYDAAEHMRALALVQSAVGSLDVHERVTFVIHDWGSAHDRSNRNRH